MEKGRLESPPPLSGGSKAKDSYRIRRNSALGGMPGEVLYPPLVWSAEDLTKVAISSRPEAKEGLDKVAAVIAAFPESNVLIEGYTDSEGSPKANLELSKKRAESVKDWLVKPKDISTDISTTEGLGETVTVGAKFKISIQPA
jgi:OmpA family